MRNTLVERLVINSLTRSGRSGRKIIGLSLEQSDLGCLPACSLLPLCSPGRAVDRLSPELAIRLSQRKTHDYLLLDPGKVLLLNEANDLDLAIVPLYVLVLLIGFHSTGRLIEVHRRLSRSLNWGRRVILVGLTQLGCERQELVLC